MDAPLVLLVDDEPGILQLGRLYLERAGFRVAQADDGEAALRETELQHPSLIILDVMLPKVDGFEVCRRLRDAENDVAILMLTARDDDIDKVIGLELGADDYLTKPFNPRELVARTKAILRRSSGEGRRGIGSIQVGDLSIDLATREVLVGGGRWICGRRSLTCWRCLQNSPVGCSHESNCCGRPGASISMGRLAPWMSTLHKCARNSSRVLSG